MEDSVLCKVSKKTRHRQVGPSHGRNIRFLVSARGLRERVSYPPLPLPDQGAGPSPPAFGWANINYGRQLGLPLVKIPRPGSCPRCRKEVVSRWGIGAWQWSTHQHGSARPQHLGPQPRVTPASRVSRNPLLEPWATIEMDLFQMSASSEPNNHGSKTVAALCRPLGSSLLV